jgi:hypothetical protein
LPHPETGGPDPQLSLDDDEVAPRIAGVPPPPSPLRVVPVPLPGETDERRTRSREGAGEPRRDAEPHRGSLVVTLGIISLILMLVPFIGVPCGIGAWRLGQTDLQQMEEGLMDAEGMGLTQAGMMCGIIGTVLGSLLMLGWCFCGMGQF